MRLKERGYEMARGPAAFDNYGIKLRRLFHRLHRRILSRSLCLNPVLIGGSCQIIEVKLPSRALERIC